MEDALLRGDELLLEWLLLLVVVVLVDELLQSVRNCKSSDFGGEDERGKAESCDRLLL